MAVKIESLQGGQHELIIDDTPFLLRAAELNNSSFSSSEYMEGVWPKLLGDNINTVLGSVGWEQIEPEEGVFEFEEVDKVLEGARRNGLKVVILWFGAYKNGESPYYPKQVEFC
jgi:beta-galactosidase GanA